MSEAAQLVESRQETIRRVRDLADEIDEISRDSQIALLSGTSASILGAAVGIPLGIAALAFTGGAAVVPLAITGVVFGAIGGTGGIVSFGAGVGGYLHANSKYKKALDALEADMARGEQFLNSYRITRGAAAATIGAAFVVKQGSTLAQQALRTGESALKVAKIIGRVAGGVSIAMSIILLPIDIRRLVETSMSIHMKQGHEKAEELRRQADKLETDLQELSTFALSY